MREQSRKGRSQRGTHRVTGTLLKIEGLTKAYPGVVANDHVGFAVAPGEVHALLGENGAGKSTLVKMIYGLVKPDSGTMQFRGAPYAPPEPRAARAAGVAMVFQHFSLFEALNAVLARPYEDQPAFSAFAGPPKPGEEVTATFCGT